MRDFIIVVLLIVFVFSGFSLARTSDNIVGFTENTAFPFFQSTAQKTEGLIASAVDFESEEGTLKSEGETWYQTVGTFFSEMKNDFSEGFTKTKDYIVEDVKTNF